MNTYIQQDIQSISFQHEMQSMFSRLPYSKPTLTRFPSYCQAAPFAQLLDGQKSETTLLFIASWHATSREHLNSKYQLFSTLLVDNTACQQLSAMQLLVLPVQWSHLLYK
jgi:hypothetical protein